MAQTKRHRTLVNPARKRRNPKRKMSAKQIKHFGTKAQKAALKRRKSSAPKHRKRTANPRRAPVKRRATRRRASHRKKNAGEIITLALNPARTKKRSSMARKRKKSTSRRRSRASHRKNPATAVVHRRRRVGVKRRRGSGNRRRGNPGLGVGGAVGMVMKAGYLIAGAAGTRLLTQAVLGPKNAGPIGYIANAVVAFVLGPIVGKVLKKPDAGAMVTLGGFVGLTLRLISDFTPFGSQLALAGMGDYQVSTFFVPARYLDATQNALVDIPSAVRPQLAAAAAMSGLPQVGTYDIENSTY